MKKLILSLAVITILFSCSSDSNSSNNNNNNSFTNSVDYEFTITINGEVHKIKGNTVNGIPNGYINSTSHTINNKCFALIGSQSSVISHFAINDVTAPNYISGQNLECQISFPNLLLGSNQAIVNFNGGYFQTLATSLGALNFFFLTTSGALSNNQTINRIPISITDLGSTSTNSEGNGGSNYNQYIFGQTLKGNYSGTIYLQGNNGQFTVPVQLSIDFKALRRY